MSVEREQMEFDVIIVGAGPAGLAAAIKLAQLNKQQQADLNICVLEKGSQVGAHILSGAVFEPRALNELIPDWQDKQAPIGTPVTDDQFFWLSDNTSSTSIHHWLVPHTFNNQGNYITSMSQLCQWLAEQAEQLGVEIFPGFAAQQLIIENQVVKGVITGDMGLAKNGEQKSTYMPGMLLTAKYTLFAEGCRGHLGKQLNKHFELDSQSATQHYAIGFKETWQIDEAQSIPGKVIHTAGWPLNRNAQGGGYIYHSGPNELSLGLIVDLNYSNPYLDPFKEFQSYKHHPLLTKLLTGGRRISYGARAITKGGLSALPTMHFAGGLLIGCDAGTLNFAKIKGNHCAMKSGMLAAETVFDALKNNKEHANLAEYQQHFEQSWLYQELTEAQTFAGALHTLGSFWGGVYNSINLNIFAGKLSFKFTNSTPDHLAMQPAAQCAQIDYPIPDNRLSFDRLSSVYLANTAHDEDQPCHLQLVDSIEAVDLNWKHFKEPAQRFCPAGVYESDSSEDKAKLIINSANCIHCKTCDIKDPQQNISWVTPEGGSGPNYEKM